MFYDSSTFWILLIHHLNSLNQIERIVRDGNWSEIEIPTPSSSNLTLMMDEYPKPVRDIMKMRATTDKIKDQ